MRKTKTISFNVSSGTFKSYDDAVKEANAIKIWLHRLCIHRDYSCKAIIGISQHNPRAGWVTTQKSGTKGRPTTIFERSGYYPIKTITEAHLHIVLFANPADMISGLLRKHLNSKYKSSVCWVNDCEDYVFEAVDYAVRQSMKIRTVEVDTDGLLNDDTRGFYAAVEQANFNAGCERVAFTRPQVEKESETPENIGNTEDFLQRKKLQCNQVIYIINKKIIYILLLGTYSFIPYISKNVHLKYFEFFIPP